VHICEEDRSTFFSVSFSCFFSFYLGFRNKLTSQQTIQLGLHREYKGTFHDRKTVWFSIEFILFEITKSNWSRALLYSVFLLTIHIIQLWGITVRWRYESTPPCFISCLLSCCYFTCTISVAEGFAFILVSAQCSFTIPSKQSKIMYITICKAALNWRSVFKTKLKVHWSTCLCDQQKKEKLSRCSLLALYPMILLFGAS